VKLTFWPTDTRLISASATDASICICVRLRAMVNKVGVWKEAATVWPISTCRLMMTPETGERMMEKPRFARSCASDAWADATCAEAERAEASEDS
jgi:hypothetical protein